MGILDSKFLISMIGQIILQITCLILAFYYFFNFTVLDEIDKNYVKLYNANEEDDDYNTFTPLFLNSVKYLLK